MNVKKLIDVLSKEVKRADRKTAQIEIWCEEQEYGIKAIGGFALSPDIVIRIKPVSSPTIKPATFKKEHSKMIKNKLKEITKQ